jgi:hypothetical protein
MYVDPNLRLGFYSFRLCIDRMAILIPSVFTVRRLEGYQELGLVLSGNRHEMIRILSSETK